MEAKVFIEDYSIECMCLVDLNRVAYGDKNGIIKIMKDGKEDSMLD